MFLDRSDFPGALRQGKNAREVNEGVRTKLAELKASLAPGVEIVTTYDRSGLIDRAVENRFAGGAETGRDRVQPQLEVAEDPSDQRKMGS